MRHQNSVFHQLTKQVPWSVFDGAVSRHGSDRRVRRLRTRDLISGVALSQFSGAASLREIEYGLGEPGGAALSRGPASSRARNPFRTPTRSGLSRSTPMSSPRARLALARAAAPAARLGAPARCDQGQPVGVDATWARFSADHCAAKLHFVYDPHGGVPLRAAFHARKVNDITAAKAMPIEPGATYVFEAGVL